MPWIESNSLNPRCRGGKWLTLVVMFVGCLVLGDDPNIILFLPYKTYGAGVFCFRPNQNSGEAINLTSECNHAAFSMSAKEETIVKWKTFSKSGIVTMNTTQAMKCKNAI